MGTSDLQPSQAEIVGNLEPTTCDWHLKWDGSTLVGLTLKLLDLTLSPRRWCQN